MSLNSRMHEKREQCGAAVFNGKIYVCGGYNDNGAISSVEVYNPQTNRCSHTCIRLINRIICILLVYEKFSIFYLIQVDQISRYEQSEVRSFGRC